MKKNSTLRSVTKTPATTSVMKKLFLAWLLVSLFGVTSCSKEEIPSDTAITNQNAKQGTGHVSSSVVAYAKDVSTTVTYIDCDPEFEKVVLYSVGPLTVEAADVLSVHLQQQLTHAQTSVRIMAGVGIVVATSPTAVDNLSPGYLGMAAGFAAENMSPEEDGALVLTRSGGYKFAASADNIYVNAVFYGDRFAGGTHDLIVPSGTYGELVAVVERGVTWYQTQVSKLPFNGANYYVPFSPILNVQHTIGPVNVPANSLVDVRFDAEASSPIPYGAGWQGFGRQVIQGTSATATTATKTLTRQIYGGIIQPKYHSIKSHVGGAFYSTAVNGAYFNSLVYSKGYTGANLEIETPSSTLYGRMITEIRPNVGFWQDLTRNVTSLNATPQVLYSVGPININANQVVEVRYQAAFQPSALTYVVSKIIRATSPTATTGVDVQKVLKRHFHNSFGYTNMNHSTAERPATAQTGQYYNVVAWRTQGAATIPVVDWGELEVAKR